MSGGRRATKAAAATTLAVVPRRLRAVATVTALASLAVGMGCSGHAGLDEEAGEDSAALRVVTTTEILADLVRNVGGERVHVDTLVPPGGDPHSYDPTPADAARVADADVTFTNHLLLEEHGLIQTIDANAPEGTPNVSLAEASEAYGANVIPLVEDIGLDVIWLGLRVRGDGEQFGATRASDVLLTATALEGPGDLVVYLTEALGQPDVYFDSTDSFDSQVPGDDTTTLPPAAHTHLNWAFTEPGTYRLTLAAAVDNRNGQQPQPVGEATFTFAVGVDPHTADLGRDPTVLDGGHTDLTVDLDTGEVYAYADPEVGIDQQALPADEVVIEVPNRALETVPDDPAFSFLGAPGAEIYQLPQAVLGRHVHGEIDPHLWQDVNNIRAYVQLIRDTLVEADSSAAEAYDDNAAAYLDELTDLDDYVRETLARIPEDRRQLITTHDAFGYLAEAYDMTIAGFVVPNPAQEPSALQVAQLTRTIDNLDVPSVFLEPNLAHRASVLTQIADDLGVRVCTLYGDAFGHHRDSSVENYVEMMRHNADELLACLGSDGSTEDAAGTSPSRPDQGMALGFAPPAAGQDAEGESSRVEADEAIGDDRVMVADGHVDVGPRFVDGTFTLLLRDDTVDPSVWRRLPDVVLQATDVSTVQVPDDPTFSFLGSPGAQVWLLPQVQQPGIVWPGWNTQDPEVATTLNREVTWTLASVDGPGAFVLFVTQDFGQPTTIFDSRDPYPQRTGIDLNTHAHANWAFTAPGIYRLDMEMSATTLEGQEVIASGSLQLAVGDTINPQDAFAATDPADEGTPGADGTPATTANQGSPEPGNDGDEAGVDAAGTDSGGSSALWLGLGILAALLVVVGAVLAMRTRARRLADPAPPDGP